MHFLNQCSNMVQANLLSLPFLMYVLGFISTLLRHELRLPGDIYKGISLYLLFAIGLKGGVAIQSTGLSTIFPLTCAAMVAGILIPIWIYSCSKFILRLGRNDSGALAAHYGSVSAVTYIAVVKLLEAKGFVATGGFPIVLTIMEVAGILMGLALASRNKDMHPSEVFWNVLSSQSILALLGGLFVGALATFESLLASRILFQDLFYGILGFFLLDMGVSTGQKLNYFRQIGLKLISFAIFAPIMNSLLGIFIAKLLGFDVVTTTIFATLCASASYIAAPAAVRSTLPDANPGYYLTCAMAVTFPFNLAIGIPLYFYLSCRL